jgi:predicted SAM-dependent methyltransferase
LKILNLGCGNKTSSEPFVINIDWSIYFRLKKNRILRPIIPWIIKGERLKNYNCLPDNIIFHNLAKGIPFNAKSIDVVYHSHFLEHLEKNIVEKFLLEVKRVLKPAGIQRIVVPDFERPCKNYISHMKISENNPEEAEQHDLYIAEIIEQSVRKEAYGATQQKPFRRFIENAFIGDARRRGETHQWMYDRISLTSLLFKLGYKNIQLQRYNSSLIANWNGYGLDIDDFGNEYKPGSLYVETQR